MTSEDAERALPTFSIAERDRRWARVRELMAQSGIDVLVAPPNTGSYDKFQADARYLTQFGMNAESVACVFPLHGKVVGFAGPSARLAAGWIEDVRMPRRAFVDAIIDALKELQVGDGTIGVCGLTDGLLSYVRAPDGVVGSTLMDRMRAEFPRARIVSATDVTGEARMVKGDEEIAFLEQGTAVSEAALQALLATARPGVSEAACCAAIYAAAIERGGTMPFMLGWVSGPAGHAYGRLTHATQRVLREGDVLLNEIEGRWGGYAAQIDQSTFVGRVPTFCRDAWAAGVEAFERTVAAMRPGVTYGELLDVCAATPTPGGWAARLVLHGRGLGDDGPLITNPPHNPVVLERPLEAGNVFVIKPAVELAGYTETARFGDSVAVTANGARRLGTRGQDFAIYNIAL